MTQRDVCVHDDRTGWGHTCPGSECPTSSDATMSTQTSPNAHGRGHSTGGYHGGLHSVVLVKPRVHGCQASGSRVLTLNRCQATHLDAVYLQEDRKRRSDGSLPKTERKSACPTKDSSWTSGFEVRTPMSLSCRKHPHPHGRYCRFPKLCSHGRRVPRLACETGAWTGFIPTSLT